jgi:hypothetical protein
VKHCSRTNRHLRPWSIRNLSNSVQSTARVESHFNRSEARIEKR